MVKFAGVRHTSRLAIDFANAFDKMGMDRSALFRTLYRTEDSIRTVRCNSKRAACPGSTAR